MKYCAWCTDVGTDVDALPASEFNAIMVEVSEYLEDLRAGGHYRRVAAPAGANRHHAAGAQWPGDGHRRSLRRDEGTLAGFYLIEARD